LSPYPPCIVMMGNTTGHYNEGYAHPDSKHKIVTVLVGFSREWPYERGRLRVLRSSDRNDYAFEFAPEFGRMLIFRVCNHSWHGFLPQKGQRMSLQLCYVDSEWYVRREYWRHSISAYAKAVPMLRKAIDWAPRRLPGL
jgi:SM-20-related protein